MTSASSATASTGRGRPDAEDGDEGCLTATRSLLILDDARVPYSVAAVEGDWHTAGPVPGGPALHWYGDRADAPTAYRLAGIPIWGSVLPETAVAARVAALPGVWRPAMPILQPGGVLHASVWRSADGSTLLPFDPDELVTNLRAERYRAGGGWGAQSVARRLYYALRPVLPRRVQIALRRAYTVRQARTPFPSWPIEPALHDLCALILGCLADAVGEPIPHLAAWPDGHRWALVLTHDVETAVGRDEIDGIRAIEESVGYRSSWNLVPERYTVDDRLVATLKAAGHEVGVHGLRHDGRDLASRQTLERRLPEMRRWAQRWGAVGFRSPATHRRWEWMPMLGFDYDSSSPDSDPFEPMPGGCCSWLPFFNGELVELPITLTQDHTAFELLRRDDALWYEKAELLRDRGGMALLIVHPDYMLADERRATYRRFLETFRHDATAWKPLPLEVSAWWRARAATSLVLEDGAWRARGPAAARASVEFARPGAVGD